MLLKIGTGGAIADDREAGARKLVQQDPNPCYFFFGRKATDIEQQGAIHFTGTQSRSHLCRGRAGVKQLRINTALPKRQPLNPVGAQLFDHRRRRTQIDPRLIVAPLQQRPKHPFQRTQAIVLQVLGQMGVIGGNQRDLHRLAVVQPPQPQHCRIDDMNNLGLKATQHPPNQGPRCCQSQFGVQR